MIDKVLLERAILENLHSMSGYTINPRVVALFKRTEDFYPLIYYTTLEDMHKSPIRDGIVAYVNNPLKKEYVETLAMLGATRIVSRSQFFYHSAQPPHPNFNPVKWLEEYGEFRHTVDTHNMSLYINRFKQRGMFIAPLFGGLKGANSRYLRGKKTYPISRFVETDYAFSGYTGRARTSEEYISDHIRHEHIALFDPMDARHVTCLTDIDGMPHIIVNLETVRKYSGGDSWSIETERRPFEEQRRLRQKHTEGRKTK